MSFDFDPSHFSTLEAFWGGGVGGVGENFGGIRFLFRKSMYGGSSELKEGYHKMYIWL